MQADRSGEEGGRLRPHVERRARPQGGRQPRDALQLRFHRQHPLRVCERQEEAAAADLKAISRSEEDMIVKWSHVK